MSLFDLDEKVVAAVIAAGGTVIGALIQLRIAWRNEVSARARGVPVTKKQRRGPVYAVALLVFAALAGGFAVSQYWVRQSDGESAALRASVAAQLAQISATAARLERATLPGAEPAERAVALQRPGESVSASATVGPCRAGEAGVACSEQDALAVTLCASVPASAEVGGVSLFARADNAAQPWSESRATPGQALGKARFADKSFERPEAEHARDVCIVFRSWDSETAQSARITVEFTRAAPLGAVANVALVPLSGVRP